MTRFLRRHGTTLALVFLALTAVVFLRVIDRDAVTTNEAEQRRRNLLEVWRPDAIEELVITVGRDSTTSGRTARLFRGPANDAGQRLWQVEIDGQEHAADEQAVDQFLGTLEFATADRRVSATATDRAALGLTAPRITIALTMGARRERIVIGGEAPSPAGAAYAEVEGRGIFVITKQLTAALDIPPERFRSRRFVPYLSTDLDGIQLDGEGGARRFVRAPWGGGRGGGFRFDGSTPEGTVRVDATALDRVLIALGRMQAEAFLPDAEAEVAPKPRVTLTLLPRDPSTKRAVLEIGGDCPATATAVAPGTPLAPPSATASADRVLAIRREPTLAAVCVPASVLPPLTADAASFVDRALIAAPIDEVTEVKSAAGSTKLELARVEHGWHLRAPDDRKIPADIGDPLVQAILDVTATRIIPVPEHMDPPRSTLRVISTPPRAGDVPLLEDAEDAGAAPAPANRVETLEIGLEKGGIVLVRRLEDGAVLEVPASSAGALIPSAASLRPSKVLEFEADRVRSLRIQEGARSQRLRRTAAGAWDLLEPKGEGLGADVGLASDLAETLGGLQAARWIGAGNGSYGLDPPRLTIEAEIAAEGDQADRTVRIQIGAPTASGSFARVMDPALDNPGAPIFVAPAALEEAAGRLLLDRAVFLVSPERIARVTLTPRTGPETVITPSSGGWTLTRAGAATPPDGAALAAAVRDVLGNLIAEGAVSLGTPEAHQGLDRPELRVAIDLAPAPGTPAATLRIAIGTGDTFRSTRIYYARRNGVAATYAIAQAKVRPLRAAAGLR